MIAIRSQRKGGPAKQRRAEPEIAWTYTPRIPPGDYPGYTRSASIYRDGQFKRWVCAVQVDVLSADLGYVIARLTWFLNLGDGDKPKATRRANYWAEWIRANGAAPPRKDRLSPKAFTMRYGLFAVENTTRTFNKSEVSQETAYSVIRRVVRWETGKCSR